MSGPCEAYRRHVSSEGEYVCKERRNKALESDVLVDPGIGRCGFMGSLAPS